MEEHVIERLTARARGLHEHREVLAQPLLADHLLQDSGVAALSSKLVLRRSLRAHVAAIQLVRIHAVSPQLAMPRRAARISFLEAILAHFGARRLDDLLGRARG